jgi:hypothetical protein
MVPNLANRGMRCLFHSIETDVIPWHFRGVWLNIVRMHPQLVRPCSPGLPPPIWDCGQDIICIILYIEFAPLREGFQNMEPDRIPHDCQHKLRWLNCVPLPIDNNFYGRGPHQIMLTKQINPRLVQGDNVVPLARALNREDLQEFDCHLDSNLLLFRRQNVGHPSKMSYREAKWLREVPVPVPVHGGSRETDPPRKLAHRRKRKRKFDKSREYCFIDKTAFHIFRGKMFWPSLY